MTNDKQTGTFAFGGNTPTTTTKAARPINKVEGQFRDNALNIAKNLAILEKSGSTDGALVKYLKVTTTQVIAVWENNSESVLFAFPDYRNREVKAGARQTAEELKTERTKTK